jgi:hypothetical protein
MTPFNKPRNEKEFLQQKARISKAALLFTVDSFLKRISQSSSLSRLVNNHPFGSTGAAALLGMAFSFQLSSLSRSHSSTDFLQPNSSAQALSLPAIATNILGIFFREFFKKNQHSQV